MKKTVLFYVQHLLGMGHLARASLIAGALAERGAQVHVVTGGRPVEGFPGPGVEVTQLPPLSAGPGGFADLVDLNGMSAGDDYKAERSFLLNRVFDETAPDIVITESFPFGRGAMRFELHPLLDLANAASPRPVIVSSIRDILQIRSEKKVMRTVADLDKYYDLVLVHGDPAFAELGETFSDVDVFRDKVIHTGIVSAAPGKLTDAGFDVVVSAGGGAKGDTLIRTAIAAKPHTRLADARWCFIVGANAGPGACEKLRTLVVPPNNLYVSRADFRALLANCTLSISQAGYNTSADVLRAGCRSIMVPYAEGQESEQEERVERLERRGITIVIKEQDLSVETMVRAVDKAASRPPPGTDWDIKLDGASVTADILLGETAR